MVATSPQSPGSAHLGPCFKCKKPGQGLPRSPGPAPVAPTAEHPVYYCECGRGACAVLVSGSERNPGQKYYKCPNTGYLNCKYFKWCDEVKESERRASPPGYEYPICACQAGVFIIRVAGISLFAPFLGVNVVVDTSSGKGLIVGGSSVVASDEGHENNIEEIEANELSSHQGEIPVQEVIEERFIAESTTEGGALSEKYGSSMIDNNETLNEPHMIDLGRQVVTHTNSLAAGSAEGEDLPIPGSEKRSKPNPCSSIPCSDSSSLQSSSEQVTVMAGTISGAIDELAVGIMNNLISVLESMNPKDHKTMSDEAAVAFKTLSSLGINFTIFHDRVTGYIERAKHLSSIETTTCNKQWTADLMSRCNMEKSCYEDVASAHSRA
ncbi:hypothetical protein AKJ16_DCAP06509 [Drosera capensis]